MGFMKDSILSAARWSLGHIEMLWLLLFSDRGGGFGCDSADVKIVGMN